jgi:allophanate hydrolase subunit 2
MPNAEQSERPPIWRPFCWPFTARSTTPERASSPQFWKASSLTPHRKIEQTACNATTDACYPYGSVQVPSGTEPIVLHRDAVSGGGYFMIGTVISADMDLIGQLQPHTPTRFIKVDMDTALAARRERAETLDAIRQTLA